MTASAADGSPLTVLVVEDEAAIRRVVAGYFSRDDFTVIEVDEGKAAVQTARAASPDVIVPDLGLPPGLDGVEGCRQMRIFTDANIINAERPQRGRQAQRPVRSRR